MAGTMHEGEVDIDTNLVRDLLIEQFVRWSALPIVPVASSGTVNAVYRLGDDLCVRLPRLQQYAKSLERELRWLPVFAQHLPLAIPDSVAQGKPSGDYPFPWAVYRWLEGQAFEQNTCDDESNAAEDLANFVAAIRRIHSSGAPKARRSVALSVLDRATRKALDSLDEIVDTRGATAAWEACLQAPEWDGRPVWTHGDLIPPNILVDQGRVCAIIDFGEIGIGDPAIDVIPAWSVFSADARSVFRCALGVDEATWVRGRGLALHQALLIIPYYPKTNPAFVEMAKLTVERILADTD
jgi:aminoglycoside phosphotransferase (APT) family kinase protein